MATLRKLAVAFVCLVSPLGYAQSDPFTDSQVQAPELAAPKRGSLVGQYAQTAFGPADVSRGGFSLPSPFSAPEDRGPLLAKAFPTYSPEGGLSEWGMGWQTSLNIQRSRASGELDFATDDLTGPWGRMVKGADGAWYAAGMATPVRMVASGSALVAKLPDGSTWTFGALVRVDVPRGTYAWYLEEVRDVTGRGVRLGYVLNDSGRPFLQSVRYGGRGEAFQYELTWTYETLARSFVDYRGGEPSRLDRRVHEVVLRSRNPGTGTWGERWRYTLSYQEDDLGPGYQLAGVQQTYASGEQPPPTRYTYNTATEALQAAQFQSTPALDGVMAEFGADAIQPFRSTVLDVNEDGRPDLEHPQRQTLFVQEGNGFRMEELPAPGPSTVGVCRPAESVGNEPRHLAQLWPGSDAYQVVDLRADDGFPSSTLTVCSRDGQLLTQQTFSSGWGLGANTRLVDVNRDRRPDLLRVYEGGYDVLPNTSAGTGGPSFGAMRSGGLMPYFTPNSTWVQDLNGDGQADLVARHEAGFVVWYGTGQYEFEGVGQGMPVLLWYGGEVSGLLDYQTAFIDFNKDGLSDLLLWQSGFAALFMNTGTEFAEVRLPVQDFFDGLASPVVVGDFTGTGGTQLTSVKLGQAFVATLDGPGTGLMRTADDGRGSVLRLEYAWSPPVEGARQRQSVLSRLTVEASGQAPVSHDYAYAQPTLHPEGKFLLGYERVTTTGAQGQEDATFLHDAWRTGLPLSSTHRDSRSPGLRQEQTWLYEGALYEGVAWKRLKEEHTRWAAETGSAPLEEWTEYAEYEAQLCPSRVVRHTSQGTLTTQKHRATVSGLAGHLHCLEDGIVLIGQHPDASLDFRHEARVTRNNLGLTTKVESLGPQGALTLQDVTYGPDFTLSDISRPGRGTTHFDHAAGTLLLQRITSPDGSTTEATARDALTDEVLDLTRRAGSKVYTEFFRFDGQERLRKRWDSLGQATEANPESVWSYQYATAIRPASVKVSTLVEAMAGAKLESVEWTTAAGEALATAQRIPEGWAFGGVTTHNPAQLETRTFMRPTAPASTAPETLTQTDLLAGTQQTGTALAAAFGHEAESSSKLHADVEKHVETHLRLVGGVLEQETVENGTFHTTVRLDAARKPVSFTDAAGARYDYTYDALGRVRGVTLPGGARHLASHDSYGRVTRVQRQGLASVEYAYEGTTGLLSEKRFLSDGGVVQRKEELTYDGIGRKTLELHTDSTTGATQSYRFYFDGATPDAPTQHTHPGVLSAVEGQGFRKSFEYRADGRLEKRTVQLAGWRTVESTLAYREDGAVQSETTCVRDAVNTAPLSCTTLKDVPDAYGRTGSISLNGSTLASLAYNAQGLLASASVGSSLVTFSHDSLTRARVGYSRTGAGFSSSSQWHYGARGLVDQEQLQVGASSLTRTQGYSAQGFLTSSTDAETASAYEYDATGLPTRIQENSAVRTLVRTGSTLESGGVTHTFDALGRTIQRGDLVLRYGPNGHLSRATRGTDTWDFLYDEHGQRIAKLQGNAVLAAYLDGSVFLDASGLTRPFRLGGTLMGVIQNNVFRPLATDRKGTVLSDYDGTPRWASPFGERTTPPTSAAALDYVGKGYDADLGLIRMGLRDYDATLHRFTTPDPYFLEQPEQCVESPAECNLYAYARSNPQAYLDPDGRKAKKDDGTAAAPAAPTTATPVPPSFNAPTGTYRFGIGIELPKAKAITASGQLDVTADTGHAFAYWRAPNGTISEVMSFGPERSMGDWDRPQFLFGAFKGSGVWPLTGDATVYEFEVTKAQFDKGIAFSKATKTHPGYYTMERNCATLAVEAGQATGVPATMLPAGNGEVVANYKGVTKTKVVPNPHALNEQMKATKQPSVVVPTSVFPKPVP
ncbi:RHS repeat-associated core domain-containing protein [Pyxidicoccus caerfyrddinensis]|uniref:RHS repeat-associated core domain-containing protein n=1 Tax=Pyxidicoccus caerfyrddinensis TaxID=2709663 RepID=UPI0013D9A7A5|nr:RHS repeat-associated core domain-containing protein [Pyxidicoccus caerfyrddinensis]